MRAFRVGRSGALGIGEIHELRWILTNGGLCVLPSDTCYALAAVPWLRGVTSDIDRIGDRRGEKISLAFGTLSMAERYLDLQAPEYRVVDDFMPGPVTLVASLRPEVDRELMSRVLYTDGTLGLRITESSVERQLSSEIGLPITTVAIYYDGKTPVKSFEDAVDIVRDGMDRVDVARRLVAVGNRSVRAGDVSTVVERKRDFPRGVDPLDEPYVVHREGALDPRKLVAAVRRLGFRDVEDWT